MPKCKLGPGGREGGRTAVGGAHPTEPSHLPTPRIRPLPMDSSAYSFTAFAGVPAVEFSFMEVRLPGPAPEPQPLRLSAPSPCSSPRPVPAGRPGVPVPAHEGRHIREPTQGAARPPARGGPGCGPARRAAADPAQPRSPAAPGLRPLRGRGSQAHRQPQRVLWGPEGPRYQRCFWGWGALYPLKVWPNPEVRPLRPTVPRV